MSTPPSIDTVHVVFKTHLDIGFTTYAAEVIDRYIDDYIPGAIALAESLRDGEDGAAFVWTTGSWLIQRALDHGNPEQRDRVDTAIRNGHIAWHALAATLETELLDPLLVEYSLSISRRLDRRYGRSTIAGKMTDVPGHTIGVVPFLQKAGVRYLHLGVNPASALPDVPDAFIWEAPDGSRVLVDYDPAYGASKVGVATTIPGSASALYVAHTNDNMGPPTPNAVRELFATLQRNYPGAKIVASTLDAYAREVLDLADSLPVVTQEIGDTWIHGAASDPYLIAAYRELLRLRRGWVEDGTLDVESDEYRRLSDPLLLVAEHTWGMNLNVYLPDRVNWEKADFARARDADHVDVEATPIVFGHLTKASEDVPPALHSYAVYEASWAEQRTRIDQAVSALTVERQAVAGAAIDAIRNAELPPVSESAHAMTSRNGRAGTFSVEIGDDGSLISLVDRAGREWAGRNNAIGAYTYQAFGPEDYAAWFRDYVRDLKETSWWAASDFGKPGIELLNPPIVGAWYRPRVDRVTVHTRDGFDELRLALSMPTEATERFGAPREIGLLYRFDRDEPRFTITLALRDKDASRLPEASWFGVNPIVGTPSRWRVDKLGLAVDPHDVVRNGNRNLHAVVEGASYDDASASVRIRSLDAPVIGVGEPRLLKFDNRLPDSSLGLHVSLQNNVWGTNYPTWYEEDAVYRFECSLETTSATLLSVEATS